MSKTDIEWCDLTINPVVGCSKCSPGCDNCYAERFAARLAKNPATAAKYAGVVDDNGKWTGKINIASDSIFSTLYSARKRKRVFVGSMCDFFHENVPEAEILQLISSMSLMPHHTFTLLTKRPGNADKKLAGALGLEGFEHIWLGVTVCNQAEADVKIPLLLQTPAAKRFVSVEPMLGAVDLNRFTGDCAYNEADSKRIFAKFIDKLDWVICGGETGHKARPMHPEWPRSLRDQCQAAGVPFFFKGWGGMGKRKCRLLDGRKWDEVPE